MLLEIMRHFLFNLSLIIIFMYLSLMLLDRQGTMQFPKRIVTVYLIAAIFTCFFFSYDLTDTIQLDLRVLLVVLGGLYFGIGPALGIATIVIRAFYGIDSGFFANLMLYSLLTFLLWRLHPWFNRLVPKLRVIFSLSFIFIISLATLICLEIIHPPRQRVDVWLAYLIITPVGTCILAYSIEFVRKNILLRKHLIKVKKLEVVEQMGAAISHEIRNPLTAAIGFVQLLQEDGVHAAKRKEYLSLVKGELESAERVIQDYLTFSKPSLNTFEELNIRRELVHILAIIQPLANRNSVQIKTRFAGIGFINGDRQKLHQCFLNVMKNGIEAMPAGGILTVETLFSSSHVTVIIKDSGMGMSKEQLERLGEPYYTTKEGKGTGLGMMVVYSIVRAMNGTLRVESTPGSGTAFQFIFPSAKP